MVEGFVDRIENGRLKGWAFDPSNPENRVKLYILHDNKVVADFVADELREDLRDCGKGSGHCAFNFTLPKKLLNLDESLITVQVSGTNQTLPALRPLVDIRKQLSRIMISGSGIEIGALHNPLWVSEAVKVTYVDRMGGDELIKHYPNFKLDEIALPDVIDDGEKLTTFAENSLDFVIANHMLEHCENPLGTIRSHLSKVKPGGVLYYTIPDMRFFLDVTRDLTPFDHFELDDKEGPERSRMSHYREWAKSWCGKNDETSCEAEARALDKSNYSIHFHVWNLTSFTDFLLRAQNYLKGSFHIETVQFNYTEVITVLRKNGGHLTSVLR